MLWNVALVLAHGTPPVNKAGKFLPILDICCCLPVWPLASLTTVAALVSSYAEASKAERLILFHLVVLNAMPIIGFHDYLGKIVHEYIVS